MDLPNNEKSRIGGRASGNQAFAPQHLLGSGADVGGGGNDPGSRVLQGGDLVLGGGAFSSYDCSGVAHPSARRSRRADDQGRDGFVEFSFDKCRG